LKRVTYSLVSLAAAMLFICGAAFLPVGCGEEKRNPTEMLDQAAQSAREANTIHAQLNAVLTPQEGESGMGLSAQGDAWLDINARTMEARLTVLGMELSLRYVGETAYLQMGGKWYTLKGEVVAGIDEGAIAAAVDLLASFPELLSANSGVNDLGDMKVGEYQCAHLEVQPDVQAMAGLEVVRRLAEEMDATEQEVEGYLRDADPHMEVWVQKDEAVIRQVFISANLELPEMGKIAGIPLLPSKSHLELTINISEYGVKVEVQPPQEAAPFKGF